VTSEQARVVLQHYRPTVDAADPHFREALEQVQRDPALALWFAEHCTSYAAVRQTLRHIPVPVGLREAILQAHKPRRPAGWGPQRAGVALAVVVVLILTVIGYGVYRHHTAAPPRDFAAYLQTMARVAAGRYTMEIETAELDVLRHYLATVHAPTDYALPRGLRALRLEGGLVVEWFGHQVAMLCFAQDDEASQDQVTKDDHDAWFFVVSRAVLPDAPASEAPQFALVHGLRTASWSHRDKTYVLATRGAQATLERLL
jgi:hypothetical protein